jgi:hypothetical protein
LAVIPIPFAKRTVFTASGNGELCLISEEVATSCGVNAGPVKLLNGVEGSNGGFGRVHIESHASRVKQLEGLGYKDVISYVAFVAADFSMVGLQEDGRIIIIREHSSMFHHVVCQWDDEMGIWSITTAIPKNNMRKVNVVWRA